MITETHFDNIRIVVGGLPEGGGSMSQTYSDKQGNCGCMRGEMGGEKCAQIDVRLGPKLILRVSGGAQFYAQVKAIESFSGDRIASSLTELAEAKLQAEANDFVNVLNNAINETHSISYIKGKNYLRREMKELLTEEFEG